MPFPFSMARRSNSGRRSAADSIATRQTDNPGMRQNRLALAFQNQRWMEEVVKLEPYMVFCWCPAYYVWPYCMLCGKFCFPYIDSTSQPEHDTEDDGPASGGFTVVGPPLT